MLIIPPPKFQKRRSAPKIKPLLLASASYQAATAVTLRFNQPVDISAIAVNSFQLNDAVSGRLYAGDVATRIDPVTIQVTLMYMTSITGAEITLDADDANGIRASETAAAWTGATALPLPYPS